MTRASDKPCVHTYLHSRASTQYCDLQRLCTSQNAILPLSAHKDLLTARASTIVGVAVPDLAGI